MTIIQIVENLVMSLLMVIGAFAVIQDSKKIKELENDGNPDTEVKRLALEYFKRSKKSNSIITVGCFIFMFVLRPIVYFVSMYITNYLDK